MYNIRNNKIIINFKSSKILKKKLPIKYYLINILFIITITIIYIFIHINVTDEVITINSTKHLTTTKWKYIIIHHGGGNTRNGSLKIYNQFHKLKYKTDILYHFIINNDHNINNNGIIQETIRWKNKEYTGHTSNDQYKNSISICLVGDLSKFKPNIKQYTSLITLLKYLVKKYQISLDNILLHKDIVNTSCPGNINKSALINALRN